MYAIYSVRTIWQCTESCTFVTIEKYRSAAYVMTFCRWRPLGVSLAVPATLFTAIPSKCLVVSRQKTLRYAAHYYIRIFAVNVFHFPWIYRVYTIYIITYIYVYMYGAAGDSASEFTYETRRRTRSRTEEKTTIKRPSQKHCIDIYSYHYTKLQGPTTGRRVHIYIFRYIIDDLILYRRSYLYVINLRVRGSVMFYIYIFV